MSDTPDAERPVVALERDPATRVATVFLDRPKVNAIDESVLEALDAVRAELAADDAVRAVVLTGRGRNFAAGADITRFPEMDRAAALAFSTRINEVALGIEALPQITISAINGYALGGGLELAMATDFRVAAADATLGQPEILLGIIPGGGGTQRLTRLAGVTVAKELIFSGRSITADDALRHGIVSSVHEPDSLLDDARDLAARYAAGPAALRLAKRAILDGLHLPLEEAVRVEAEAFADTFDTEDRAVGVASFLEHGPGKASFLGR
jgi:enoyl-CoA hydratase/carnithine racemase